ncbi:hypothetical protein MN116_005393, partial [Schistosoma mekongi]
EFHELQVVSKKLIQDYEYLDMPKPDFSLADELANDLNEYSLMWLDYDNFVKELQTYAKENWISFKSRYYVFEEFLTEWSNKLRSTQPTPMTIRLEKEIDQFMNLIPVLKWLKGDHLTRDHWLELFRLIGLPKELKLENVTFGDFFPIISNIISQSDALKSLGQRAQAEIVVREALQELDLWGASTTFTLTEFVDSSGQTVYLVKDWKEIVSQVGDNMALLASLEDSPYIDKFSDRSNAWTQRLSDLEYCLNRFQSVQRKWVYLEPIMGRGALPKETARYAQIDEEFRRLLNNLKVDNRVVSLVNGMKGKSLKNTLNNLLEQLTRCQRALNEYLEEKRSRFPRFYFLGDDDLLEILGQSTNPIIIQTHLKKLFQGIYTVQFNNQYHQQNINQLKIDQNKLFINNITSLCSFQGEIIHLHKSIPLTNEIEISLEKLTNEMRATLKNLLIQCINEYQYQYKLDINNYPEQILILTESIKFCRNVENALNCGELNQLKKDLQSQLAFYTSARQQNNMKTTEHCTNSYESNTQSLKCSRAQACKLSSLILDTIHSIDIIDQLIRNGAVTSKDWIWQRQLRFYVNNSMHNNASLVKDDNNNTIKTSICMADAEFTYAFEYQGNSPRLVHTPLTDKCYLTLTQAMRMGLGGNPYGPAGTGKTESVKALGCLMGRQVLVFNCDEGIDLRSMTRIFVGIVKCGAWGCFDEFNRLEASVLSAISMQIQIIQDALKCGTTQINLLGRATNVDPNSGIFITLNPIAKGYGGRQKLPDNLKQLFRPISMTKPDVDLIAEMILFSEGFYNAQLLGRKLVSLFSLAKQLLSVQQHYDWGLRALKTVLCCAGTLLYSDKQKYYSNDLKDEQYTYEYEVKYVIQAIKSNTLAKLTNYDAKLFENLLNDVFPNLSLRNIQFENQEYIKLIDSIHSIISEHQMVFVEAQVQKAIELYEQLSQRIGVVLVGPSGCGKSTVLNLLRLALNKMGKSINSYIFNPKSMLRTQLLGQIEPDTREWTDGVLTYSARCVVKESMDQKCWIVSDGDIDPEWIESLNSVLDDNHLLTLPNGERIQFSSNVNFIFETHELIHASPATVSRMGVVYVSDEATDPHTLIKAWLMQQPESEQNQLKCLIDPIFYQCLEWIYQKNEFMIDTSPVATIFTGLSHLVGAITPALFTVGLIRGLGANLSETVRHELAIRVYEATGENPPNITKPLDVKVDSANPNHLISYPKETSIVLLGNSVPRSLGYNSQYSEIPSNKCIEDPDIANAIADGLASGHPPLVLTPDVRRFIDAFRCWLDNSRSRQSFLLVGPEGCGKTLLLDYCFATLSKSVHVVTVQCSAQTTPNQIIHKLMQYCICVISTTIKQSNSGRVLRPKEGDHLILYLRNLNLPKPDKWGSCQLIAFLQQILTYHGYYDSSSLEFIGIEGIQFVGSFTPSTTSIGLGRYSLSKRFTSALRLTVINYPDKHQLINIYTYLLQTIITSKMNSITEHKTLISPARLHNMSTIMIQLLSELQHNFRADEYAHCVFTPHSLTQWLTGLLRYDFSTSINSIWAVFGYEAKRLFRDCLPGESARQQFDKLFTKIVCNNLNGIVDEDNMHKPEHNCDEIRMILKMATEDYEFVENEDMINQIDHTDDAFKNGLYWFATWSGKHQLSPGSPVPLHGRPLGSVTYMQMKEIASKGLKQLARDKYPQAENLVLFPDFIDYICRIDRILSHPSGSLFLAGRSGIGRRSALNLVAHLHQLNTFRLHTGRGYQLRQFITDMKNVCQSAGIDNQPTLLIIEDYQLINDSFLEIINSLLSCGESSSLMNADELDMLVSSVTSKNGVNLKEHASEVGYCGSLTEFFAERVHRNLHFAIILDIDDYELFNNWFQSNPSFYKYCSIQWMDSWSKFSQLYIPKLLIHKSYIPKYSSNFIKAFVNIHNSAPYLHKMIPTPRHFITLCTNYNRIEQTHRHTLELKVNRLKNGLLKLKEARERVAHLKKHAIEQGELLAMKQTEANKALEQISTSIQGAAEQRTEMEKLRNQASDESTRLERRKLEIDNEMNDIEPLVHQARSAVGNIKSEALSEIRALRAPPDVIRDILEGVLLLMGIRDTSWVSMRGFLAKRGVQEEILNFDARKITPDLRVSVEQLLAKNQESFEPRVAKRASVAAAPLAAWVQANVQYTKVLERIAPLEAEHANLKQSLIQVENSLTNLAKGLSDVDSKVASLRGIFENRTSEATTIKLELDKTHETLSSAETLVNELESEHARWEDQITEITIQLNNLPTFALIASAFITYLSAYPEEIRRQQITDWVKDLNNLGIVPTSTSISTEANNNDTSNQDIRNFDLRRFLSTEQEQLLWHSQGLPSDQLSGENAVTVVHTKLCPYIIDPSSRALNWLKVYLKDQRLEVVNQQSCNFITTLELAIRFGKCLIVQEVNEIEPILMPLLLNEFILQGSRNFIRLGDKLIDYHEDFRLFLCTRKLLHNMHYIQPINANALVTIINFISTQTSLTEQLLDITLQIECPQLEEQRQQLIHNDEKMQIELANLENNLLEELANAHGNILENKELLTSLNRTKQSSLIVTSSLKESLHLQVELNKERNMFYPLAETGSRLYFALKDLMKINHMYQFSLNSFLSLFQRALTMPHDTKVKTLERTKLLQKCLEQLVYENVCRALFKQDRIMFALYMVRIMRPQSVTDEEWLFFTGLSVNESCHTGENILHNWLDHERTRNLMKLKAALPNVYENLCFEDSQFWTNWLHEDDVEMKPIPKCLQTKSLTDFHFMILAIQALRPDRLYTAMSQFACRTLDLPQLNPSTLNLHRLFETETKSTEPILILISPGVDPSQELNEAATLYFTRITSKTTSINYRQIAMGHDQTDLAISELHSAVKLGDWLCLKNLHLVIHWLPILEKEINNLLFNVNRNNKNVHSNDDNNDDDDSNNKTIDTNQRVHKDFRLWLTAEPCNTFPSTLLQGCLKIAYEAPPGIKRNLQRTYETWPRNYISQGNSKTRATLLACLAWFHAVVQERRTYIPQGWTKFYEFTFSDLRAAADIIDRLLLTDQNKISRTTEDIWSWIHGLFYESIYGGRMDNMLDLSVLNSYLISIFSGNTLRNLQLGPFKLPGTIEYKDYIVQINALPDHDLPTYFNLPANIENSLQKSEANRVIAQLRLLNRPSMDMKHKFDKNLWSKELGPILILWKKLNQGLDLIKSRTSNQTSKFLKSKSSDYSVKHENKLSTESPIQEFLHLELYNALQLVHYIHSNLASLSRACRGTQLVTETMHEMANSILRGETPDSWQLQWPEGPDEVVPFLRELIAKSNAIHIWTKQVENGQLSSEQSVQCLDLGNLFHPATFLNALRQQTARQLSVPIDTLKLSCQWLEPNDHSSILSKNNDKHSLLIRVTNLKLEGANFRNGQLCQNSSNDPSLIQLPDVLLKWIPKDEEDPLNEYNSIDLPIYLNNTREHLVTFIRVPCSSGSQNQWIQAGTALLLSCL